MRVRAYCAAVCGVATVLAVGFGTVPVSASATATAPPSPAAGRTQPTLDLGIVSERQQTLNSHAMPRVSAGPARTLTACAASWRVVDNQNGSWNNFLGGVASVSPSDIWAVGNSQSPIATPFGNGDLNLAQHWDGAAWGIVSVPQPGPDGNDLSDVAAIATDDVWAVGLSNTTKFIQSTAFHWDGSSWTTATMPSLTGANLLNDVTAFGTSDVWAVGQVNADNGAGTFVQRTLTEHWNGSAWSVMSSPNVGLGDNVLFGVGATRAGTSGRSVTRAPPIRTRASR